VYVGLAHTWLENQSQKQVALVEATSSQSLLDVELQLESCDPLQKQVVFELVGDPQAFDSVQLGNCR
jgi:hypothetical protein